MPHTQQGLPFAKRSQTSYRAAVAEAARRAEKTRRYLQALVAAGARGLTDVETIGAVADAIAGLQVSSVCSIRNAAMDCGLVIRLTVTRRNPASGHRNAVYTTKEGGCPS